MRLVYLYLSFVLMPNNMIYAFGDYKKVTPTYKGTVIDISDYKIFKLYKGADKIFIADSLNDDDIRQIVKKERNIWWMEASFHVENDVKDKGDIWLYMYVNVNAYEVYLNKKLFLENGKLGNSEFNEKSGSVITHKLIEQVRLVDGVNRTENKILIKFSNFEFIDSTVFKDIIISPHHYIFNRSVTWVYAPLLLSGFFILAMSLNVSFYFAFKKEALFIILATMFAFSIGNMLEDIIQYTIKPTVDFINTYFLGNKWQYLSYLALIFVLVFEFDLKGNIRLIISAIAFILFTLFALNILGDGYGLSKGYTILLCFPVLISMYAVHKKKGNSIFILSSLLVLLLLTYIDETDLYENSELLDDYVLLKSMFYYFDMIGLMVFAFAMVYTSSVRIFKQQKILDETKLKSARLENQLLQKHISPHFLMNSLMSLQELIDTKSEIAGKMIDALSEEFHLLADISKNDLIPLDKELEICRIHLKIMGYQQRADFTLELKGIEGNEMVPPAIIHTLVENGLTHGYSGKESGLFILEKKKEGNAVKYLLFNNSNNQIKTKNGSGTGLKYVEARLEESYPGRWKLESHKVENGWLATITVEEAE